MSVKYVFRSKSSKLKIFLYFLVYFLMYLLNMLSMYILINHYYMNDIISFMICVYLLLGLHIYYKKKFFKMKKISIITPTFNEEDNVKLMVDAIANVAKKETNYSFEHIFIDNASTDGTVKKVKELINENPHVGLILNYRNFEQLIDLFMRLP